MVLVERWMSETEQTIWKQMKSLSMILRNLTTQEATIARWWARRSPKDSNLTTPHQWSRLGELQSAVRKCRNPGTQTPRMATQRSEGASYFISSAWPSSVSRGIPLDTTCPRWGKLEVQQLSLLRVPASLTTTADACRLRWGEENEWKCLKSWERNEPDSWSSKDSKEEEHKEEGTEIRYSQIVKSQGQRENFESRMRKMTHHT